MHRQIDYSSDLARQIPAMECDPLHWLIFVSWYHLL